MRLPRKSEIKQCHSHTVGCGMRHRLPGKEIEHYHSLPVGHGIGHDWWDCLAKKSVAWVSLTICWSWHGTRLMRLPGKEIKQCHSLSVGNGIRHDWWDFLQNKIKQCHLHPIDDTWWDCHLAKIKRSVTHFLLGMRWDMIASSWQRNKGVSHTLCWLSDETWLMAKTYSSVTHCLLVMGWDMIDETA